MAKDRKVQVQNINHGGGNAVYCLGLVGTAAYYIEQASGAGEGIIALIKALVWPAFVFYDLLKFIGA